MAIKLADDDYYYYSFHLLLSLLSLHFCYSSGLSESEHLPHHHHHPIPRDLSIPILSLPLKHFPSFPNKYHQSHPFSHFRVLLRSRFWLLENPKLDDENKECTDDPTSPTSPLRKLLDHIQITKSTSANTFMPVNTEPSLNPTTPITVPSTNQIPAFPYKAPPVMAPITVPPPTDLGQTWCVARPDASETALQHALDYACGIGGADCTAIHYMRSCYNPNTVRAHASYAFNSYYQRYPVPSSCVFSATAMLVNVNPSSSSCTYPSSSDSSYNRSERGEGSVNGLPVLDADYSGSTSVLGSDNPVTSSSNSSAISATAAPLIFAFTLAYIRGNI